MRIKVIIAIAITGLAGCGGSNDGSATSPTVTDGLTTLETYNDGSGFVGFRETINGTQYSGTLLRGDIASVSFDSTGTANIDNLDSLTSTAKGEYYSAIATVDNVQRQVVLYQANNDETVYMVGEDCNGPCVGAYGVAPSDLPSGTWTYSGDFIAVEEGTTDFEPSYGTFAMAANFSSQTAGFSASTLNGALVVSSNDVSINTATGTFGGTGSAVSPSNVGGSGNEWNIDIYGSFHGAGATSVSGVASSNLQTVTGSDNYEAPVNGAFAGSLD